MIVSITVVTIGLDACGAGAATSVLGMLPARAVVESAHARVTAITNFFMIFSPLDLRMQDFEHQKQNRAR
jgi:hypothetical protein